MGKFQRCYAIGGDFIKESFAQKGISAKHQQLDCSQGNCLVKIIKEAEDG